MKIHIISQEVRKIKKVFKSQINLMKPVPVHEV